LSNIIKTRWNENPAPGRKVIGIRTLPAFHSREEGLSEEEQAARQQLLSKYSREAARLITNSKNEAEAIRKQIDEERRNWSTEKDRLSAEASRQGFEAGYADGREQGLKEFREKLQQAAAIIDRSKQEFKAHLERSEKDILNLAMKAAEKILHEALALAPEKLLPVVKSVLKEALESKEVNLHIHPDQYLLVMENKEELDAIFPNDTKCYIYPDESLHPLQVYIETDSGRIDASIDSQLSELKAKLLEYMESDEN
jgi:flagellar assembly protein FliH